MMSWVKNFLESCQRNKRRESARKQYLRKQSRPCLETMEQRLVMSTFHWAPISNVANDTWEYKNGTNDTNWKNDSGVRYNNVLPGTSDTVVFDQLASSGVATCAMSTTEEVNIMEMTATGGSPTLQTNGNTLTIVNALTITAGGALIDVHSGTLNIGDLQATGGSFINSATGVNPSGSIKVGGDGATSNINDGITGINHTNFYLTGTLVENSMTGTHNVQVGHGANIFVYSGGDWKFDAATSGGNGGITLGPVTDGDPTSEFYLGDSTHTGGIAERTAGTKGALSICTPVEIYAGGDLIIQAADKLTVTGLDSNNNSVWVDNGEVELKGGNGTSSATLTMSGNYYQKDNSSLLKVQDGSSSTNNTSYMTFTSSTFKTAYFYGGTISLPMYNAGAPGTNSANGGKLTITGNCVIQPVGASGTMTVDEAIYGNPDGINQHSGGDLLQVLGNLTVAKDTTAPNTKVEWNVATYGTNAGPYTWGVVNYTGTLTGDIHNDISWSIAGAFTLSTEADTGAWFNLSA